MTCYITGHTELDYIFDTLGYVLYRLTTIVFIFVCFVLGSCTQAHSGFQYDRSHITSTCDQVSDVLLG